ncbi:hypothetical protein JYA63_12060 [Fictibacillus nanhaiensis]|uniref:Uncharacterized protein n=2 Tax=Fictibacillus TaxID=1329200 RepID=A0A160IKS8_9BACL|nr:hypothetical protein [Fictibacillus phosphorivorans]ANC76664.1 hypothetical protein ABE65_007565 [Fictibacillus phosphorivorans]MBN3555006.1 hypothetical protein [Fictibacillus nanhaiensis]
MMPRRLNVQSTAWKENKLILLIEDEQNTELTDWKDSERMLVDSDGLAFIYVLEDEEGFNYISIGHNHWNEVKKALVEDAVFVVQNEKREELELTAFSREMDFLTDNIQGNANYGQQMEDEVIKVFGTEEKAQ